MSLRLRERIEGVREWFRELRRWRRLSFTRAGWLFTAGALAIGMAAIPTGNNLLFLLLGAMLGFIAVSGWLSEQSIRALEIERRVPRGVTAGRPFRLGYRVVNGKRRMPSMAVELREPQLQQTSEARSAWLASIAGAGSQTVRAEMTMQRRGVYPLDELTLSTGFPFGLFRKERDLDLPGSIVVWPRSDLPVRDARVAGRPKRRSGEVAGGVGGARGEFRNLRDYRPGDDPRDVHWRSSARLGQPLVREFERERAEAIWICVDQRRRPERDVPAEEEVIETAASLARAAVERGQPVGLTTSDMVIDEGTGPAQLERILDALARVEFTSDAAAPRAPIGADASILVSTGHQGGGAWADVYLVDPARAVQRSA